jgi:hypothetical protein
VYLDGVLQEPTSGTVSLYKPDATTVFSAQSSPPTSGVARFTVTTAHLASLTRSEGYALEWALTMPDDAVHTFRVAAAVVRRKLYAPISDRDLYRVQSTLNPNHTACITDKASYQDVIEEAWRQISQRLQRRGTRPQLMASPPDVRDVVLHLTLALIFEDLGSRPNGETYWQKGETYRTRYESAWSDLQVMLDRDEDGAPDDGGKRKPVVRSFWLGGV